MPTGIPGPGRLGRLVERLDGTLWLIPAVCVVLAIGLSYAAEAADHTLSRQRSAWFLFGGGPDGARALFSAVATSMLTFSGLVFSITILVLQLASNQFSPRALRTFFKDRASKVALGVFMGTYVYALFGLRLVRSSGEQREAFVPALSAWLTVPLALVSVAAFIAYLHHVAQSIRAVVVIGRIGEDTRRALERLFPEGLGEEVDEASDGPPRTPSVCRPVESDGQGVIVRVDEEALLALATKRGVTIELRHRVGEFVPSHAPLFVIWGEARELADTDLRRCVDLGPERTLRQDAGFGFRQLVDVAGRALSPSTNDPTTAVEVLDQLHDLLRRLVTRRFPSPERAQDGVVRLILPRPDFGDYLALALDEIIDWGKSSLQIRRRLRLLLDDLLVVARGSRHAAVLRKVQVLERATLGG